jgi:hypothetical protein
VETHLLPKTTGYAQLHPRVPGPTFSILLFWDLLVIRERDRIPLNTFDLDSNASNGPQKLIGLFPQSLEGGRRRISACSIEYDQKG